jgi:hypothetical protein
MYILITVFLLLLQLPGLNHIWSYTYDLLTVKAVPSTDKEKERGTYFSFLEVNLTNIGELRVLCHAPVWNSSDWISSVLNLTVLEGLRFSNDSSDKNLLQTNYKINRSKSVSQVYKTGQGGKF